MGLGSLVKAVGGVLGAVFGGGGDSEPEERPDPSKAIGEAMQDNHAVSLSQISAYRLVSLQAVEDRKNQKAADLVLSMARFDAKLETSKLGYLQHMRREENRHVEKIEAGHRRHRDLTRSAASPDLPPPEDE